MNNEDYTLKIPFGAEDSGAFEYTIPEGYIAEIKDGKVIVKKAESEDEKIRKWIYGIIKNICWCADENVEKELDIMQPLALAWLKKQGEQKPFDYENANIQQKDFAPKSAMEAVNEEKVDNANKIEPKDYSSIDPHFFKTFDKVEPKFHKGEWVTIKE